MTLFRVYCKGTLCYRELLKNMENRSYKFSSVVTATYHTYIHVYKAITGHLQENNRNRVNIINIFEKISLLLLNINIIIYGHFWYRCNEIPYKAVIQK